MIIITWSKDYNTDAICQVTNNYKITHPQNYTIKGQCYLQFRTVCYFLNIMPLIFQKKPFPQTSNLIITAKVYFLHLETFILRTRNTAQCQIICQGYIKLRIYPNHRQVKWKEKEKEQEDLSVLISKYEDIAVMTPKLLTT